MLTTKRRTDNWIGDMLRNCILKHVIEGKMEKKIEVTGRRRRRRKKLKDDLKETRGYCKLEEEAISCSLRRTGFGSGYGAVVS